jgi:hypothetical protein
VINENKRKEVAASLLEEYPDCEAPSTQSIGGNFYCEKHVTLRIGN